jgi:hypothetical protein
VAKVRTDVKRKKDQIDAHEAANDADWAEAYAADAIDFALDAIDEAEYAGAGRRVSPSQRGRAEVLIREPALLTSEVG